MKMVVKVSAIRASEDFLSQGQKTVKLLVLNCLPVSENYLLVVPILSMCLAMMSNS